MHTARLNNLLVNRLAINYKAPTAYYSSEKYDYEYLEKSIIPTYHFQKSLTKLKIPKLEDTFDRYLSSIKPILSETEYKDAEKITKRFQMNEAAQLDKEIRALDEQDPQGNYISESWFDMYLKDRSSIVLNYNPFVVFVPDPNPGHMDQAIRATNFLISSVRFMKSLRENKLKPEIFHLTPEKSETKTFEYLMKMIPESISFYGAYMFNAYPLDMSQYFRLFNSTRIPKQGKDVLKTDNSKNHILIIHKGNFYTFPVLKENGLIVDPQEIYAYIKYILDSDDKEAEYPIGVLTSENRDVWANVRSKLVDLGNEEVLNAIDTSLYCIALDQEDTKSEEQWSHQFLHGDSKNRWFDKNHTLIVNKDGNSAVNFEHSWGDGVAVLRYFNEIYHESSKNPQINPNTTPKFETGSITDVVKRLEFKLDDSVKNSINEAQEKYTKRMSSLSIKAFEKKTWGKNFVKPYKLSPDSIMQSGFQVAYYKRYGKFVGSYESASTSAFKKGRTETVRPATMATKHLAEFMSKKKIDSSDTEQAINLLRECTKLHNGLVKNGAMGKGFDRHLFAMKYHAEMRNKQATPDFYKSHAYKYINHCNISTSTLPYPTIAGGGFAPVVPDGFGFGYRIIDDSLGAAISSYQGESELNELIEELHTTFDQFHSILSSSSSKK